MSDLSRFDLGLSANGWLLVLALLLGIGFSVFVYRYTNPPISKRLRYLLIALRSIALSLIIFIVFEPILSLTWFKTEAPIIGIIFDTSGSMGLTDAGARARKRCGHRRKLCFR